MDDFFYSNKEPSVHESDLHLAGFFIAFISANLLIVIWDARDQKTNTYAF